MHWNQKNDDLIWLNKQITRLFFFLQCPTSLSRRGKRKERGRKSMLLMFKRCSSVGTRLTIITGEARCIERCLGTCVRRIHNTTHATWSFILIIFYIYTKTQLLLIPHDNYKKKINSNDVSALESKAKRVLFQRAFK